MASVFAGWRRPAKLSSVEPVSLHRLAEERSRVLHALIAVRLMTEPTLVERARARVDGWRRTGLVATPYVEGWSALLGAPLDVLAAFLTDSSERARELRQVSPFAGAVDPRTRWSVWKRVRRELGR